MKSLFQVVEGEATSKNTFLNTYNISSAITQLAESFDEGEDSTLHVWFWALGSLGLHINESALLNYIEGVDQIWSADLIGEPQPCLNKRENTLAWHSLMSASKLLIVV